MTTRISIDELNRLTTVVEKFTGIYLGEKKRSLVEARLRPRIEALGLANFNEYLDSTEAKPEEMTRLINAVTTNETCFFRNSRQLDSLVGVILPELVETAKAAGKKKLRIWSAAAASGEEIYTLAMLLAEQPFLSPFSVELVATDINTDVLAAARNGVYSKYSLRNTPQPYIDKYFIPAAEGMSVFRKELLPPVRFEQLNLLSLPPSFQGQFDVVFCCNVLIYFPETVRARVAANIHRAMNPQGFLFIGHSESLHNVSKEFKLISAAGMPVYRKE